MRERSYPKCIDIYCLISSFEAPVLAMYIADAVASAPLMPSGWLCVTSACVKEIRVYKEFDEYDGLSLYKGEK